MVILGLGSNMGPRKAYLRRAVHKLRSLHKGPDKFLVSHVYESDALKPAGAPSQWDRPFLNLAVGLSTDLNPPELLAQLKKIEVALGRQIRDRWAPREIDIDILSWDEKILISEKLNIPHAELLNRPFALLPLAEIMPQWRYPLSGPSKEMTAGSLAQAWQASGMATRPLNTRMSGVLGPDMVGIINVTPDSFSDGGLALSPEAAVERARELSEEGAHVLDIGAESTRPHAQLLTAEEEWARLGPALAAIGKALPSFKTKPLLSVDTRHGETAERALVFGVDWVNDVMGLESAFMKEVLRKSSCRVVIMHSLGVPASPHAVLPDDRSSIEFVHEWFKWKLGELEKMGLSTDRVIIDPGIGFGKTAEQSWEIIEKINRFDDLGCELLVGHSRKSFLSTITAKAAAARDQETAKVSAHLGRCGVDYLRVHNVKVNRDATRF